MRVQRDLQGAGKHPSCGMELPEPVEQLIRLALAEDLGSGDVTVQHFVPAGTMARAVIAAREPGILSGTDVATAVFRQIDPELSVRCLCGEGTVLAAGQTVLELEGAAGSILSGERTALNFLQRLSGIATATSACVRAVDGTAARILDTRKTTPGWRWLEKQAVKAGGGTNHRMGLYDMAMVKDNHLPGSGGLPGLQAGIDSLHRAHPGMRVELEADTVDQVRQFLGLRGVSVILLDNMTTGQMRECVALSQGSGVQLEASGGITMTRLAEVAGTGVDWISMGAITHSARALDLGLDFQSLLPR